jgi:phage tail sheath protein FI
MAYSRPGVYISERLLPTPIAAGVTANAAGAVVAPFAQGPEAVTLVSSWYEFTKTFGGYNAAYPATFQVGAFFSNGGRELYVQRVLHTDATAAHVNLLTSADATVATVTAKNAGTDGNNLRVVVAAGSVLGTYTLTLYKEAGIAGQIADDVLLERYENVVFDDNTSSDYAETVINLVSPNITISASAGGVPVSATYPLASGSNGTAVTSTDYTAYKGGSSVFEHFTALDRPLVFFLPAVQTLGSGQVAVYDAAASWSAANNGFVVVETAAGKTVAEALSFSGSLTDTSNAAVYYPHLYISDPLGRGAGALRKIGPSGSVVGLYLSTDASRGVFKSPAGIGSTIQGIVAVEKSFTSTELDSMNSSTAPVNPIRQIPGAGLAVMGARTLLQDGTANKYVNMRRSLIYIRKNLKNLTEFAIFENNDERLWAQLRNNITVFLNEYRNQGGLRGATPAAAFFVKCDAENNSAQAIANGEVHIQVGVALQYPAEFIVIDLSQKTLN